MKAAVWHKAKDLRVEQVDEPSVKGDHDVKVKVSWCGICGSDLHEYAAGPIFIPVNAPHPISGDKAPIVMGHEFGGEVTEVGSKVTKVKPGDRVAIEPILAPNENGRYIAEKYNLTELLGFHGLSGGGGGFSEYTVVGEHMAHKMPDSLADEQAALVEPAAVALHAIRESSLKAGDTAAVFGTGPIGLMVIDALKAAGASTIYAVEISAARKRKAEQLGAVVIDPSEKDAVEEIHRLTGGGVDVAFEVTGIPKVLNQTIHSAHRGGEIVVVSIWESEASFQPNDIVIQERTMKGIIAYRNIYPQVMELMTQGYFSGDDMITARIGIDDVVDKGFEALLNDKSHVKIMVKPE
ncbi:2,3-butanediol dehydrogenase [Salisediminibacterium halotolerans]|uniref:2,3-butanediol dehydrogenase n=1 Tax=Salisediminibacterium halotolerans TaxID=517425 RepID=UPI000EB519E5|nr:2,3-butanediol dehydrogenase [Salisediminibacterium halotolerans]RLJ71704.1 (R,R)-butanediol dehydrogenase/meso-butanediol dehydrogenase/diacetyl reductase [Actinophytocola xinjiangensis]RPE86854.1 (R,R)-butanediol dehydrogenase/meso-butanediol dehydrogenase/diacetyl reductase [Salisediminibacterium halotolerans]TWG32917.1 (R,R)-butanediol dehydrogenase/meso-butanediol dehydrogenase/diacetyl reductase [Salisediminibacterium halotolerans]GEL07771.1 (R,R)-butanediol dehydrogenase [Salisedimini